MYQTAEHAVESSLRLLALPIAPTSATAVVIDALRRHFDDTYLEHESSGYTKHDWHANAVMVIKQAERTWGAFAGVGCNCVEIWGQQYRRLASCSQSAGFARWDRFRPSCDNAAHSERAAGQAVVARD